MNDLSCHSTLWRNAQAWDFVMLARKEPYGGIIWRPIRKPGFSIIRVLGVVNYSYNNKTTYYLLYKSTLLKKCTGDICIWDSCALYCCLALCFVLDLIVWIRIKSLIFSLTLIFLSVSLSTNLPDDIDENIIRVLQLHSRFHVARTIAPYPALTMHGWGNDF